MTKEQDERSSLIRRLENRVSGSPVAETILNIFKAGLATAPFCGGLASLITDYIPSSRFERLEKFAAQVADDLYRLQEQVREEYLHNDDFAFMFEKCFRGVAENPQKEKIEAFRGILVNSAVRREVAEQEKELFVNLINSLSVVHIRLLSFMANPKQYLETAEIPENRIQGGFSTFLPIALPGIPLDVIRLAFEDLYRYGLTSTDASIFGVITASSGLRLLGDRVSKLGHRFIEFCRSPA